MNRKSSKIKIKYHFDIDFPHIKYDTNYNLTLIKIHVLNYQSDILYNCLDVIPIRVLRHISINYLIEYISFLIRIKCNNCADGDYLY
jgi:hypothetical protein